MTNLNRQDYLFRVSLKAVIRNEKGELLVVKEKGHSVWELPGGGMDHGETFEKAMSRELLEEVGYAGKFTMKIVATDEAATLHDREEEMWQLRLIYEVQTENREFSPGTDAEGIQFVSPEIIQNKPELYSRLVSTYCI